MADRWNGVTLVVNLVLPVQCVSLRPGSTALSREREIETTTLVYSFIYLPVALPVLRVWIIWKTKRA